MVITLQGEPKSTNHLYKSTCRNGFAAVYLSQEGKTLKTAYQWEAKAQWRNKPIDGDVELWVTLYFGTKRRGDVDNFNKLALDALTGIVYHDDRQVAFLRIERSYDKKNPRIEIDVVV